MKNVFVILFLILLGIVLNSCEKQRLPKGEYETNFTVQCGDLTLNPCYHAVEILESNKSYLIIDNAEDMFADNDTLFRNGNVVTGTLHWGGNNYCTGNNQFFDDYSVTGTISKEKGVFYIRGGLTTNLIVPNSITQTIDTLDAFGSFEIKSNF
jgi:hypothetical protein